MVHRLPRRSGPWKVTTPPALPSQQGLSLSVLWAWDALHPDLLTVNLLPHLAAFTQIPPPPVRLTQIVQLTKQPVRPAPHCQQLHRHAWSGLQRNGSPTKAGVSILCYQMWPEGLRTGRGALWLSESVECVVEATVSPLFLIWKPVIEIAPCQLVSCS